MNFTNARCKKLKENETSTRNACSSFSSRVPAKSFGGVSEYSRVSLQIIDSRLSRNLWKAHFQPKRYTVCIVNGRDACQSVGLTVTLIATFVTSKRFRDQRLASATHDNVYVRNTSRRPLDEVFSPFKCRNTKWHCQRITSKSRWLHRTS